MARRKQQESTNGHRAKADRSYSLADALSATQQHTVPVLPADATTTTRRTAARETPGAGYVGSAMTTPPRRATLAPRTTAHPTLADTTAATSTIQGKAPRRTTQQPVYYPPDEPANRQPAAFAAPETRIVPARPSPGDLGYFGGIPDEVAGDERDIAGALAPGRPTIALPTLTDAQLPAVRDDVEPRELAAYQEPSARAVFIRGSRKAPRPYISIVPRRVGRRPFVVQFIAAMVTVMAIFTVVTLASPLGQSAAFANAFQSYSNAVHWVPTPTPRPTATPIPNYQSYNPGQQVVINEIVAVFGGYASGALAVARCESGYDPNAWNSYPIGNSHAEGVFQILFPSTWDTTSYAGDSPYNYVDNIHAAYQIFSRDGYSWREWECKP